MIRRPSTQRGFTLVELMVVVAIIAVLSGLLFSVGSRTYGANSANVSDQVVSTLNFAKMRAVSSRRVHEVQVTPSQIQIWASDRTGFGPPDVDYVLVQTVRLPTGATVWDAAAGVCVTTPCSSPPTAANASLDFKIYFKPDGAASAETIAGGAGATLFLTDTQNAIKHRVLVYRATGSTYARQDW